MKLVLVFLFLLPPLVAAVGVNSSDASATIVEGAGSARVNDSTVVFTLSVGPSFQVADASFNLTSSPPFAEAANVTTNGTPPGGGPSGGGDEVEPVITPSGGFSLRAFTESRRVLLGDRVIVSHELTSTNLRAFPGVIVSWVDDNGNGEPDPDEDQCSYDLTAEPRTMVRNGCAFLVKQTRLGSFTLKTRWTPSGFAIRPIEYYDSISVVEKASLPSQLGFWDANKGTLTTQGVRGGIGLVIGLLVAGTLAIVSRRPPGGGELPLP